MTEETDLTLSDGRTLHVYDTGADHARLTAVAALDWLVEHAVDG